MSTRNKLIGYMLCPSLLTLKLQQSAKVCLLFKEFNLSSYAALNTNNRQVYVHLTTKLGALGFTVILPFP